MNEYFGHNSAMGAGASTVRQTFEYKQHLYLNIAIPREWPALMSARGQLNPEEFGRCAHEDDANFFGAVSFQKGSHVNTVVSFPGMYAEDWACLVRRSIKRTGFEMHSSKEYSQEYAAGSTSCVFLTSAKFCGTHVFKSDGSDKCWCADLYGDIQPFGCTWFHEWQKRLEDAVARGHSLVVVYKAQQVRHGLSGFWP